MSKINQIQQKILELDGGAFQKLADNFLAKLGYAPVNPIGSVVGSNKTKKGTPDTLIPLENGNYIFAEYTTQQDGVEGKFLADLEKCFDEGKTGIPLKKIERVILCSTTDLDTNSLENLRKEAQIHGVLLNVFGLQSLSYDLLERYPGLALDHLGVEIDTKQILSPEDFVASYNKNKLATTLDTTFMFRENEVNLVIKNLEEGELIILSGAPGVGKTRLAIECCKQFTNIHPNYKVRFIFNRGPDIYNDLQVYFSEPSNFLIVVDDANRLPGFDYVLQKVIDHRDDQRIKVLTTVRDYALDKIREMTQKVGGVREISITPFKDEEIKEFVKTGFGIQNHLFLDRIVDVSNGNPRLAVMIALIAKEADNLQSISDVSSVYEIYFRSIREDLEGLGEPDLLKVAGIVIFYRVVDYTNKKQIQQIKEVFQIEPEVFWKAAKKLHELEILDMYENEMVRPSEQILSTYLFYLAFFKEGILDFGKLFNTFFPEQRHRIVEAINPIFRAFDPNFISSVMEPVIRSAWEGYRKEGEETRLLYLMEQYWFHLKTETLIYVKQLICNLEEEKMDLDSISFKSSTNLKSPTILSILSSYNHAEESVLKIAVDLIFDYLSKRPSEIPQIIYTLTDRFGFKYNSHLWDYIVQRVVIDKLWIRTNEGEIALFARLFLLIAKSYLHIHFDNTESKNHNTFTIINFDIIATESLINLRFQIWDRIFILGLKKEFQSEVIALFRDYYTFIRMGNVPEVIEADAKVLFPFFLNNFDVEDLNQCITVNEFLNHLEEQELKYDLNIRTRFTNKEYTLYDLLTMEPWRRRNFELDYDEFHKQRIQKIREFTSEFDFSLYKWFFTLCKKILSILTIDYKIYQVHYVILGILRNLANQDKVLFAQVIDWYLSIGEPLSLQNPPVQELIDAIGTNKAFDTLNIHNYPNKDGWLMAYYIALPECNISKERLESLYLLYEEGGRQFLIGREFGFLLKFRKIDNRVIPKVIEILLKRFETDPDFAFAFSSLLNPHDEVSKRVAELFRDEISLLERAYLIVNHKKDNYDYDSKTFSGIIDLDPGFIEKYVDDMYDTHEWFSRHNHSRNYTILWLRDDYKEIMGKATMRILAREHDRIRFSYSLLGSFFVLIKDGKSNDVVIERQDHFINNLISAQFDNRELMILLYEVIADFSPERRRHFIALFLDHNQRFEDFKELSLMPTEDVFWGSGVPVFLRKADYLQSLLPLLDSVNLLEHKYYIEQLIRSERAMAEDERKRDFMRD
jgi:hypothetical protein